MTYLAWSDDLNTQIPAIDAQHRSLLQHINGVLDATDSHAEGLPGALEALIQALEAHFRFEEQILAMIDFPALQQHQDSHALQLQHLRAQQAPTLERADHPSDFAQQLGQWLVEHIRQDDLDFGPTIREWMHDAAPPDDPFRKLIGAE